MTPQHFVSLAARLCAIYFILLSIRTAVGMINAYPEMNMPLGGFGLLGMPLGCAALLWIFPHAIAEKLIPRTHDADIVRMPARQLAAGATALLGVSALITALPDLAAYASVFLASHETGFLNAYFDVARRAEIIGVLLEAILGIFLLARPWIVADRIFPSSAKP